MQPVAAAGTSAKNLAMGLEILHTGQGSELEAVKRRMLFGILGRIPEKSTLADVGCFDGRFLDLYRKAGFSRVDGYDNNSQALAVAESRGMSVKNWDFNREKAPANSDTYDAIVCADVLEHAYDTENLVAECRRILRKRGRCAFVTPNLVSLENRLLVAIGRMPQGHPGVSVNLKTDPQVNLGHLRMGTAEEWSGLFRAMDMQVERVSGIWRSRGGKALALGRPTLASALVFECSK